MFDSSSFVDPTPLAHADASRDVLPRGEMPRSLVLQSNPCRPLASFPPGGGQCLGLWKALNLRSPLGLTTEDA
ncbi:hypothetical protein TNCV_731491 [Trichonephila clavipes]|nr:hypothetical protein TNCV_731491 [Trichonephila clavipes]